MTKGKIIKQIRTFCLSCMGNSSDEVAGCTAPNCPLYDFRQGKDPFPSKRGPKNPYFSSTEYQNKLKSKRLSKE